LAREVIVRRRQKLVTKVGEIRQLAVERKAEPFPFPAVVPLERLRVAEIVGPARRIADVADRRPAGILPHDAIVLGLVVEPKRLDHRADLLVSAEDLLALGTERREPGRQLASILKIEEHSRHQAADLILTMRRRQSRGVSAIQVINRRDPAFMVEFAHWVTSTLEEGDFQRTEPALSLQWERGHYRISAPYCTRKYTPEMRNGLYRSRKTRANRSSDGRIGRRHSPKAQTRTQLHVCN
jgi:hypothetical protein